MSAHFCNILRQPLSKQLGQPLLHIEYKLSESARLNSKTFSCLYSGPKSIVLNHVDTSVIKAYYSLSASKLHRIALNYEASYREHPELFPQVEQIGEGYVPSLGLNVILLSQVYLRVCHPTYAFEAQQWDSILAKWDQMRANQTQDMPKTLLKQISSLQTDSASAFKAISQDYFDSFAAYQAPYGWRLLKKNSIFKSFRSIHLPEPDLSPICKIIGDISPKHVLCTENYLAFDLEKYAWGDPAKDLSTLLRYYLYRDELEIAERVMSYLSRRYHDRQLLYRVYLAALGSGSRLIENVSDRRIVSRYHKVLQFYDVASTYFKKS
jgi:hypothetical protein